ncbi:MAG: radical SAM protein [Pseudobutyrivibrio sp.]|nr:radical SAM protein [Pseudobutyrivibrio sp.]
MAEFIIFGINRHRLTTDGEGITTLIGLAGCPLNCRYCINKNELNRATASSVTCSPKDLVENIMQDYCYYVASGGGVTFGGGESLLQAEAIHEFSQLLPPDVKVNVETSLNVPQDMLQLVLNDVDEFIIDIKDMNPLIYEAYTGLSNRQTMDNLQYLASLGLQDKCLIRIPNIPEYNDASDVEKTSTYVQSLGFNRIDLFDYVIKE